MWVTLDFLPLTVDYREKFASAEDFHGFFKREARPSNEEIQQWELFRVLRPLFQRIITMKLKLRHN